MRIIQNINNEWFYKPSFDKNDIELVINDSYEPVRLPHCNIELPYSHFDENAYQFVSHYKRKLYIEPQDLNKYVSLHFEGVMTACKIFLNNKEISEYKGGYLGFEVKLPPELLQQENDLCVVVDSNHLPDVPPFGGYLGFMSFGGIYREVQLQILEHIHIHRVHLTPKNVLTENKALGVKVEVINNHITRQKLDLSVKCEELNLDYSFEFELNGKCKQEVITFDIENLPNLELWDLNNPKLYKFAISVNDAQDPEIHYDNVQEKIGFRKAEFTANGFFLNNKPLKLIGLNRHQIYPYVGGAMPKRVQAKDADILKYELGLNIVRTSHYPQSRHFLDRCDEIGLLVLEEIPGWQHIGDELWQDLACRDVKTMINRDYNHPSIVLWGVRINESFDNHDFYTKTNLAAKNLDTSRQTGGIRCNSNSELLEDVYTMNDFVHNGKNEALIAQQKATGLNHLVPYLVTEHNGHMYPTRRENSELRNRNLTLRHYNVINAAMLDENICGAIGWCAFDYHITKDFCSGDKINHHGVMDMYRLPKFAAYAYRSQKDPSDEVILEPLTMWNRGETVESSIFPIYIATNCERIECYIAEKLVGKYFPDKGNYKGLKHPPIVIDHVQHAISNMGIGLVDITFVGYVRQKKVISRSYLANKYLHDIKVKPDDLTLQAHELDATRVIVTAVDTVDNILGFYRGIIKVTVSGAGNIIGNDTITLNAGTIAFWIKNNGTIGDIVVNVTLLDNPNLHKSFTIKCE